MLQKETVDSGTLELLRLVQTAKPCSHFHLAGGTALALFIGHRKSVDLDLFTQSAFNQEILLEYLELNFDFSLQYAAENTLKGNVRGVKVDLIMHPYPMVGSVVEEEGVSLLAVEDIAAMKINAIAGNGTRVKDFIDLYFLLKDYSVEYLMMCYKNKYKQRNLFHALKSLVYFDDINVSDWPYMLKETDLLLKDLRDVISDKVMQYSNTLGNYE